MTKDKSQIIIRKSNKLVEAKYRLDIWETRVFTKALSMIHKNDVDFKSHRIYLSDMISEFGLVKGLSYKFIKDGAESLNDRTIRIIRDTPTGKRVFKTKIIAGVDSAIDTDNEEALYIDISFHPAMKESLLALKSEFTTYDIRNVVSLPSTYSYRVYELLKQYERIKERKFELQELKELVGAVEFFGKEEKKDHYPLYGNFRQKVLLKAQRDLISHTDISFTFEPIKRGRKVVEIKFFISKNIPQREKTESKREEDKPNKKKVINSKVYEQIEPTIKLWIQYPQKELIFSLLEQGKTEDHIRTAVKYTQNKIDSGKKVDNPVGYFMKMVDEASKQGNLFDAVENRKVRENEQREAKKELEKKRTEFEAEIKQLYTDVAEKEAVIIRQIDKNNPTVKQEVIEELKASDLKVYNPKITEEENLKRISVKAFVKNIYRKRFPKELKEVLDETERIEKLRRKKV